MKKAIIAVLIVLAAATGLWFGRAPYKRWKQDRFLKQSRAYLAKSDYRNAVFSARETLAVNPANTAACGIIAQIAEGAREPEAIAWRSRILELNPSTSNRIELARTALLFGNPPLAIHALRAVNESERDTVDYHNLMALVASAEGNLAAAESHCARAAQLDPTNHLLQLNLAVLRLQSTNAAAADAAARDLERLAADPACRRDALRQLAMGRLRHGDKTGAVAWSQKLQLEQPSLFGDDMLHLMILQAAGDKGFGPFLANLEKAAPQKPEHLNGLAVWLRTHQMSDEALRWLHSLPVKKPPDRIVTEVIADCYDQLGDWARMQAALKDQDWGELDFIRLAKLARASRQLQQEQLAKREWHSAVVSATGRLQPLYALLTMAEAWGWGAEKEEVAWLIVQRFPSEIRALEMLSHVYQASGNTPGLHRVYALAMKYEPNNVLARNNYAAVSLLLGLDLDKARDIALENYTRAPQDADLASTYAFALHLQGRTKEAVQLMEKLKPEQLQKPPLAAYYGVLLVAAGSPDKAKPWLEIGTRATLLPEEKKLLDAARAATTR